jgi:hypothetical protein
LRYTDPTGEWIYAGNLNDYEQAELLRRLNYTYGCTNCASVGSNGFIAVDTSQVCPEVAQAAAYLTDAITNKNALFSVEVTNNSADVAFGDSQAGMASVVLPGSTSRTSAVRIRLDFGDDKAVSGDKASKEAFLNLVFAHEVSHFWPGYKTDPDDQSSTGRVVDAVNEIQFALGLPLRAQYQADKRDSGGVFVSVPFGEASRDKRTGQINLNKTGGMRVNQTDKTITWIKSSVGGKGIN